MEEYRKIVKLLPEVDPMEDPLRYYKMPVVNRLYFKRLSCALSLLEGQYFDKLLDIGYGTGILLADLKSHCRELYGVDKHGKSGMIKDIFDKLGVSVNLRDADLLRLPFPDETFDCVTCVSVLDHIKNYSRAIEEIYRVMKRGGVVLVGLVTKNIFTDFGFAALDAKTDIHHVATHKEIYGGFNEKFQLVRVGGFPSFAPENFSLYTCKKYLKVK